MLVTLAACPPAGVAAPGGNGPALDGSLRSSARQSDGRYIVGLESSGSAADFVLLERNIFEVPSEEIRNVRVLMTFVGGRRVFDRGKGS